MLPFVEYLQYSRHHATYYMDNILATRHINPIRRHYSHPHFIGEETETWRKRLVQDGMARK